MPEVQLTMDDMFNVASTSQFDGAKATAKRCDHKFIDSKNCLKCGWEPTEAELEALRK
jgi:hypothetical protein